MLRTKKRIIIKAITEIIVLLFIFSDHHQDKYEYNQTNYRNKEMLHILILPRSLKVFSSNYCAKPLTNSTKTLIAERII